MLTYFIKNSDQFLSSADEDMPSLIHEQKMCINNSVPNTKKMD